MACGFKPRRGGIFALVVVGGCGAASTSPADGGASEVGGDAAAEASPGEACGAALAPWPQAVALDGANCASRPTTACSEGSLTPQNTLESKLLQYAIETCQLPSYIFLKVEFSNGCPSSLSLKSSVVTPTSRLTECLTGVLGDQKWTCAADLSCAVVEHDTLP